MSITIKQAKDASLEVRGSDLAIGEVFSGKTVGGGYQGLFLRHYDGLVLLDRPRSTWEWKNEATGPSGPKLVGRKVNITITVEE